MQTDRSSFASRVFDTVNIVFLLLLILTMIVPLLNTFALAFSTGLASMQPDIILWPKQFSTEGFSIVWTRLQLWQPFLNNVIVTLAGTFAHVLLTAMAGYVLVQQGLPGKKLLVSFILLTMTVPNEAIMVPLYIVNKDLGLLNTLYSLINYSLVSGFSILLMRNFFLSVPSEMAESARMDARAICASSSRCTCLCRARELRPSRCSSSSAVGTASLRRSII
ncbi:carbohydrate ABC transporter permease [Gordoniibacillus kamchatkensis]|uniref:carbohydrate ABC transporter permease n=1 Tax=Gordoniibacillus kamchatkensis TaxID=1590651 RepID=UPI000A5E97C2|nr:carbohydrate ABC transporter permease [Paenibacillus sp. VKM B-2647]